jgi:hypothetical protein
MRFEKVTAASTKVPMACGLVLHVYSRFYLSDDSETFTVVPPVFFSVCTDNSEAKLDLKMLEKLSHACKMQKYINNLQKNNS